MKRKNSQICDTSNSGLVQTSSSSDATASVTLQNNYFASQAAGNLNIVTVGWGSNTGTVSSVTDTAGNTYALAYGPARSTGNTVYIYYAKNIVSSAAGNKVTVTTSAVMPGAWVDLAEYTGYNTANPLDGTGAGGGAATTAISTSSFTTTNACNMIFSGIYSDGSVTKAGTNFTARSFAWGDATQDRVVSTAGSYSATATQQAADKYAIAVAAFKKNLGAGPAQNSIRNVQWSAWPSNNGFVTSRSATFLNAQTAGNLNVVAVAWYAASGTVTGISDTAGNSYTLASGPIRGTGLTQYIYYAKNINASASGNALTVTTDSTQQISIIMMEYAGLSTTSPLDKVASNTGTTANLSSGSVTTTAANELILGINKTQNHGLQFPIVGTNFRPVAMTSDQTSTFVQDRVVSSTGTYSSTATYSGNATWIAHIITFK